MSRAGTVTGRKTSRARKLLETTTKSCLLSTKGVDENLLPSTTQDPGLVSKAMDWGKGVALNERHGIASVQRPDWYMAALNRAGDLIKRSQ